jgi:hypothetical protein
MKQYFVAIILLVAVASGGCSYESKTTTTGPSTTGLASLIGNWGSASAAVIPTASTCVDFKWNATEQTGTSAKGTFSATCAGDLKLDGTASATLSGTTITWSANGTAKSPVIPACPITLTGTAELGVNSIRVPYSGSTCLGPVSGVEVLNRR